MTIPFPALPLPGNWLLAHALLFAAAAALTVVVAIAGILVGRVVAWGINYWRASGE